ncbi:MAG: hypothetical protein JST02_05085 [Bacteroidetes bacterium]|nr:hypothetical protein [Bacteroidota bacterium]
MKRFKRYDNIILYGVAFMPLLSVLLIILFYFHARILLGRFPVYANPDPGDLDIYNFYGPIASLFFFSSFFIFPIWVIGLIIQVIENKLSPYLKPSIIFLLGIVAMFCLSYSTILEWFFD